MKVKDKLITKLLKGIVVMIIVPLILVGSISIYKSKKVMEENLKLTSIQTLQEIDKGFTEKLSGLCHQVTIITYNVDVKDLPSLENAKAEDTHEDVVGYVQELLLAIQKTSPEALNVYFAGEYGELLTADKVLNVKDSNYKDMDWYKKAKEANGNIIYSNTYTDKITGKLVTTVAQSVKGSNGEFIGVAALDLEIHSMEEYIENVKLLKTGYVILTDTDGNIILGGDKNKEFDKNISDLEFWKNTSKETQGNYDWEHNGEITYVSEQTNSKTGWKLIGLVDEKEISESIQKTKVMVLISVILCSLISIGIVTYIVILLTKQINKINTAVTRVSKGDFTEKIIVNSTSELGELGNSFNIMIDNISKLIKNVESKSSDLLEAAVNISSMSQETTASAEEVTNAIDEVSKGATNQAQAAQRATISNEELSNKIDIIDNHTKIINTLSSETGNLSSRGIEILNDLVNKARKTKKNSIESKGIVKEMTNSIEKINYISNAIFGITEQTNLLALNASIEAARAGESGKGFAVVAEEIKKLAEESKKSTNEIKSIISEINDRANQAQNAMEESTEILESQNEAIKETREVFNKIADSITTLIEGISEIKTLIEKMNEDKEMVKEQVENIASVSEEAASISEEVTASAEEVNMTMDELTQYVGRLNDIADKLKEEISTFKLSI